MKEPEKPIFVLRRMSDTSDEALISEIKRVDEIVNRSILTVTDFSKHARVNISTVQKRFGSWEAALKLAGLEEKFGRKGIVKNSGIGRRNSTDEEILEELRSLAGTLGKDSLTSDEINSNLRLATSTLIKRFGSTGGALTAAGIKQSKQGQRYSNDDLFENLLNVWTKLGRQPKYQEMNVSPSVAGGKAYVLRYGSWIKALEAFVIGANSDSDTVASSVHLGKKASPLGSFGERIKSKVPPEDERSIRLGQRFRILNRDSFKCVLCGNSPSIDQSCRLHVDHILPFSRGGKTIDSNLRSVCALCNVGRGNRYDT